MLPCLSWLTWLKREDGEREAKVITARAIDVPVWRLAQRYNCCAETIRRWHAAGRSKALTVVRSMEMCSGQPVGSDMTSPPLDFSTIADRLEISVEQSGSARSVDLRRF
jgi:hypothetical protein